MQVVANRIGIGVDEFMMQERVHPFERSDALIDFIVFVREITHRCSSPRRKPCSMA